MAAFARELVTGLVTRGVRVTLVSFGEIPLPDQTSWMDHLHGLDYRPTAFRLEWMQEAEQDLPESSEFLLQRGELRAQASAAERECIILGVCLAGCGKMSSMKRKTSHKPVRSSGTSMERIFKYQTTINRQLFQANEPVGETAATSQGRECASTIDPAGVA